MYAYWIQTPNALPPSVRSRLPRRLRKAGRIYRACGGCSRDLRRGRRSTRFRTALPCTKTLERCSTRSIAVRFR